MVIDVIMNVALVLMLLSIVNLVRYTLKIRKTLKQHKDNPNIKGISIVNGEVKVIENIPSTPQEQLKKEMVRDESCGKEIEKKDAYRLFKDGKEYFFCSWECGQAFMKGLTKEPHTNLQSH